MDFQAEFVRFASLPRSLILAADPPSNFYAVSKVSKPEEKVIREALDHLGPSADENPAPALPLYGSLGRPFVPSYEKQARQVGVKRCSVRLNFCGEGLPGRVDRITMRPEQKKWRCFLCPVKFLWAMDLHLHVAKYHPKLHERFFSDCPLMFRGCRNCCEH